MDIGIILKKPVHIFIDGPDGSSKTTQSRLLSKILKIPVTKMTGAKKKFRTGNIEESSKLYNEYLVENKDTSFIVDRGFTSSLVYSKVYNRKGDLSYITKVEKELKPIIIILTATNEELLKRRERDKVITTDYRYKVKSEYDKLAHDRKYTLIDTTNLTAREVSLLVLWEVFKKLSKYV